MKRRTGHFSVRSKLTLRRRSACALSRFAGLLLLCQGFALPAASQGLQLETGHLARVDSTLGQLVASGQVVGAEALIWQSGEVVYHETAGNQDLESGVPMTDSTLFRIYSMTKPVTSVAALMLYEEGALALDDPVSAYIPAFADLALYKPDAPDQRTSLPRAPTIHDLLTHRAGFTYGFFSNTAVDSMYRSDGVFGPGDLEAFCERLAALPLLYAPGERWHYSVATDVLGRVVEVASGQSLDSFFETRIFAPLEMHDTAFSVPPARMHRLSTLYTKSRAGAWRAADRGSDSEFAEPVAFLSGGGGLVSTPLDYVRFAEMLLGGGRWGTAQILKPSTVALMTRDHLQANSSAGWGFGLGVEVFLDASELNEPGMDGMYGWAGAANTFFFIDPQSELIGMIFTQLRPFNKDLVQRPFKEAIYAPLR